MRDGISRFRVCGLVTAVLLALPGAAQEKAIEVDLGKLAAGQGWKIVGRAVTAVEEDGRKAVRLDERPGEGVVWLEGFQFSNGVIELDLKGKDVLQRSFLGVVFHGVDEKTYEAVYFRPFNFKSSDPVRRVHAVQYVSHPVYTWQKLRGEHSGVYEKAVDPVPDPNGWFHARIVVQKPKVSVYVNDATQPSLVVDALSDRQGGWIGLFVGNGSGGAFANLRVTPSK